MSLALLLTKASLPPGLDPFCWASLLDSCVGLACHMTSSGANRTIVIVAGQLSDTSLLIPSCVDLLVSRSLQDPGLAKPLARRACPRVAPAPAPAMRVLATVQTFTYAGVFLH